MQLVKKKRKQQGKKKIFSLEAEKCMLQGARETVTVEEIISEGCAYLCNVRRRK